MGSPVVSPRAAAVELLGGFAGSLLSSPSGSRSGNASGGPRMQHAAANQPAATPRQSPSPVLQSPRTEASDKKVPTTRRPSKPEAVGQASDMLRDLLEKNATSLPSSAPAPSPERGIASGVVQGIGLLGHNFNGQGQPRAATVGGIFRTGSLPDILDLAQEGERSLGQQQQQQSHPQPFQPQLQHSQSLHVSQQKTPVDIWAHGPLAGDSTFDISQCSTEVQGLGTPDQYRGFRKYAMTGIFSVHAAELVPTAGGSEHSFQPNSAFGRRQTPPSSMPMFGGLEKRDKHNSA